MKKARPRIGLIMILSFLPLAASAPDAPTGNGALSPDQSAGKQSKGLSIFSENCAVCHTLGAGDDTVPDLKGVTLRRTKAWLKSFIQFPSKMFAAKDPVAMELLAKYKEPMSDPGLTPEDVDAVIEYLMEADSAIKTSQKSEAAVVSLPSAGAMNPPGQEAVVNKPATQAEAEKGKALFQGTQRFSRGGPSCYACHDLRNSSTATAGVGRLAKELTGAYSRLGEVRMRAILEKTPFPLMREAYGENPLTVDEISDLAAFLERASKRPEEEPLELYGDAMSLIGLAGFAILLGFYGVFWSKRRNHPVNKDVYDRQTKSEDGS